MEKFEILRCRARLELPTLFYRVNIRYKTTTEITPRTIETAEAFGLGVDEEKEFIIYNDVNIDFGPRDVVYVTGDSGSGKSVLLRELEKILGSQAINIKDVVVDETKPLVDTVGVNTQDALELLSRVGLNDAFLFIRKFPELSDGQRYRYKLAKLISQERNENHTHLAPQYWVADEFCSTLDRDTAKIVAFNVQKHARKLGKGLIVATCNRDLFEDLAPNVYVDKRFGEEVKVQYFPGAKVEQCSLVKEMRLEEGTRQDYAVLAGFHYREKKLPVVRKIWVLKRPVKEYWKEGKILHEKVEGAELIYDADEIAGALVYSYSPLSQFGRKQALGYFVGYGEKLNSTLTTISRVVVHPKYRTIGLGVKLVKETLPLAPTPCVELTAVMAQYNPFAERAGMTKICETEPDPKYLRIREVIERFGFNPTYINSIRYNLRILQKLEGVVYVGDYPTNNINEILNPSHPFKTPSYAPIEVIKQAFVDNLAPVFMKEFTDQAMMQKNEFAEKINNCDLSKLAKLIKVLGRVCQKKVYLFWSKPCSEERVGCKDCYSCLGMEGV